MSSFLCGEKDAETTVSTINAFIDEKLSFDAVFCVDTNEDFLNRCIGVSVLSKMAAETSYKGTGLKVVFENHFLKDQMPRKLIKRGGIE